MQHAKRTDPGPISAGEEKREDNRGEYLLLFPFSALCQGVALAAFVVRVTSVRGASTWVLARMSVRGSHSATRTNLFRALMLQRRVSVAESEAGRVLRASPAPPPTKVSLGAMPATAPMAQRLG